MSAAKKAKAPRVLTPEQQIRSDRAKKAIADRKARLAEEAGTAVPAAAAEPATVADVPAPSPTPLKAPVPDGKQVIHIHFLDDGATLAGKIWYRGEELRSVEGDAIWPLVTDKDGNSILNLTEDEQWDRFGKHYYAPGPWPGKPYDAKATHDGSLVDPETKQPIIALQPHEIAMLEAANKERGLTPA